MSISGVRTAYDDDEVAEVGRLTRATPARRRAEAPRPGTLLWVQPPWPSLVVHSEIGDVNVWPASTPGGLACLPGVLRRLWGGLSRPVPGAACSPAPRCLANLDAGGPILAAS